MELQEGDWALKLTKQHSKSPDTDFQMMSQHYFYRIYNEFISLKWFITETSESFFDAKATLELTDSLRPSDYQRPKWNL